MAIKNIPYFTHFCTLLSLTNMTRRASGKMDGPLTLHVCAKTIQTNGRADFKNVVKLLLLRRTDYLPFALSMLHVIPYERILGSETSPPSEASSRPRSPAIAQRRLPQLILRHHLSPQAKASNSPQDVWGAPGLTTRSKDATRGSWHRY